MTGFPHRRRFLPGLTVFTFFLIIGWLIYAKTLSGPFVFDDFPNIVKNPFIRITTLTSDSLLLILRGPSASRPTAMATFAANYFVNQYRPAGYHLVNILIHILVAFLVFQLARQTLQLYDQKSFLVPFIAALLWLVHPLHIQSVTYIVQRMNSLAALFFLLALLGYIRARRLPPAANRRVLKKSLLMGSCGLFGLLALGAKPNAAILPLVIVLYEWFFLSSPKLAWKKKQFPKSILLALAVFFVLSMLYLGFHPVEKILSDYENQNFTLVQRLLTEPVIILYYLSLLAFPHPNRLQLIYDISPSLSLTEPPITALSLITLSGIIAVALLTARRHKIFSFALLWYLLTLAIESSFIGRALAFDHRTYLPSVFPIIAVSYLLIKCSRKQLTVLLIISAVIGLFGFWAYSRNHVWTTSISLWRDTAHKAPFSAPAANNLGLAHKAANNTAKALKQFRKTIDLDPGYEKAYNNLAIVLRDNGQAREALPYFQKALSLNPRYPDAYYNLGLALFDLGKMGEATTYYEKALDLNPLYDKAHNNLGIVLQMQGKTEKAMTRFRRTLEINPYFEKAYNNIGISYFRSGKLNKALVCFQQAVAINPDYVDAKQNLEKARQRIRQYGPAISRLSRALQEEPANAGISFKLAQTYETAGLIDKARGQYEETLRLKPAWGNCLLKLGNLYAAHHMDKQALITFQKLIQLVPDQPTLYYNLACLYARQHEIEKALETLQKAIQKGYNDWAALPNDPDLENIRSTSYYKHLISGNTNK